SKFPYVGAYNGSSAVYLGNGWAISAAHTGDGATLSLPSVSGTPFAVVAGSRQVLRNADNSVTDLVVFRLETTPALSSLTLATSTPAVGTSVFMAGNGRNRLLTSANPNGLYYWDVNGSVWTETTNTAIADASGYKWAETNTLRWGTNNTSDADPSTTGTQTTTVINTGFGPVTVTATNFNTGVSTSEAQAAQNDSGGGLFDTSGRLVGVLNAVNSFNGQPGATSVIGNSTFSADLATYYTQIASVTGVPEPTAFAATALAGAALLRRRVR
ncbi:MAG TPA: hypothetical protein VGB55_08750, partial [Tepidisphaeraceae bacterium]